jgi:hypothetical protein
VRKFSIVIVVVVEKAWEEGTTTANHHVEVRMERGEEGLLRLASAEIQC